MGQRVKINYKAVFVKTIIKKSIRPKKTRDEKSYLSINVSARGVARL